MRYLLLSGVLAALPAVAGASPLEFFQIVKDTDYVSAGAGGLRGTGNTEIELSGVSGTVDKVYLYWHGPTNDGPDGPLRNIDFNGTPITGTSIGTSDDNFWGRANSQAYRADVTALVSGDGNYQVSGIAPNDGNGASLVAYFDDGDDSNNRDIVSFDGNDANFDNPFDPLGWFFGANGIQYAEGLASIEFHVSDGQAFSALDDSPLRLNGEVLDNGGIFQGDSVPSNPNTTVRNGGLWDIETYDLTPNLKVGANDLLFELGNQTDALSLVFAAINLPFGSTGSVIPVTPSAVPLPASFLLFLGALGCFGVCRRARA